MTNKRAHAGVSSSSFLFCWGDVRSRREFLAAPPPSRRPRVSLARIISQEPAPPQKTLGLPQGRAACFVKKAAGGRAEGKCDRVRRNGIAGVAETQLQRPCWCVVCVFCLRAALDRPDRLADLAQPPLPFPFTLIPSTGALLPLAVYRLLQMSSSSSSPSFGGPMAAMPRLLVCPEGLEDPKFLRHFAQMGLTPAQEVRVARCSSFFLCWCGCACPAHESPPAPPPPHGVSTHQCHHPIHHARPKTTKNKAELVAVLKRLTLPMDQIVAHGRASQATQAAAGGAPPRPPPPPPLSFFPPSPEALLLMTGMANCGAAGGGQQPPQPQSRMPPPAPAPAAPPLPAKAKADEKEKEEKGDRVVLVTVAGDRGGGARLFYPSRLAREGTEAAFRKEVSGLVATHLLPLLLVGEEAGSVGDGGEGIVEKAGIEWRPAASYRRTVLRLTAGLPTVVLVRRDGEEEGEEVWRKWEEEGAKDPPPSTCDVMVKGVV